MPCLGLRTVPSGAVQGDAEHVASASESSSAAIPGMLDQVMVCPCPKT